MAKKIEESPVTNHNVNNNHNNINIDLKVERPRAVRRTKPKEKEKPKPNWVVKAIVLGLIGLAISLLGIYITGDKDGGKHKPAVIENGTPSINGQRVN